MKHGRVRHVRIDAVDAARRDDAPAAAAARAWCGSAPARYACAAAGRRENRTCRAWRAPDDSCGIFSASKLWKSSSTSGPVATSNPACAKIRSMRKRVRVTGCRLPGFLAAARARSHRWCPWRARARIAACSRRIAMHLERGLDRRLGIVDALARGGTLGGGQRAQALELLGEQPLLAEQRTRTSSSAPQVSPTRRRRRALARRALTGIRACAHELTPRGWLWLFPRSP